MEDDDVEEDEDEDVEDEIEDDKVEENDAQKEEDDDVEDVKERSGSLSPLEPLVAVPTSIHICSHVAFDMGQMSLLYFDTPPPNLRFRMVRPFSVLQHVPSYLLAPQEQSGSLLSHLLVLL